MTADTATTAPDPTLARAKSSQATLASSPLHDADDDKSSTDGLKAIDEKQGQQPEGHEQRDDIKTNHRW